MLVNENLELIARLKDEPGYILLCDHLQAAVDDMADGMAEDDITSDLRLQRVQEWKAARKLLSILKTYPESLAEEVEEQKKVAGRDVPEELSIDPVYLARLRQRLEQDSAFE